MRPQVSIKTLTRSLQALAVFGSGWEASFTLGYSGPSVVNKHVARLETRCGVQLLRRDEQGRRTAALTQAGRDVINMQQGESIENQKR